MKVVFMGSDPIALPVLKHLLGLKKATFELSAVYTQPDRKSGRGMKLRANEIKTWALEEGLPVHQPLKCGAEDAERMKQEGVDLLLVMAYGQLLPSSILKVAPLGILNLHASILPRLRGASPIHTSVALGLPETGVSLMRITPKMDAGPVADVERVAIGPSDTSGDVHAKLGQACIPLMDRCLDAIAAGNLTFHEQDLSKVTYCRIIEKSDADLDFNQPAEVLASRVRAFTPWPGSRFPYHGKEIHILEAEASLDETSAEPGSLEMDPPGTLRIACGSGSLVVKKLQRPGGNPLAVETFLRGFHMESGEVLQSREMRALESATPFPHRRRGNSAKGNT
ncbi:methionyl-tRNA formyltransferase [Puniceicoccales bacterium CK1056]|uniref:Methionyl-tRNA formyltransferase n=1 Tax=Oceanipulchritudo coccoides TaxID=2706888 RepID=A0A6B2M0M9_9BACT|nr:methionyl-tRNA formyltransferase [Oceanipulchritudo coccoides]NDV62521.1 methionyl-tRNA formyltransferase [Oceanipulchritudo coccoides]